jgi:hypothetical protein
VPHRVKVAFQIKIDDSRPCQHNRFGDPLYRLMR